MTPETAVIVGNALSLCAMVSDSISGTRKKAQPDHGCAQTVDKVVSTNKRWGHFVMQRRERCQDIFDNSKLY